MEQELTTVHKSLAEASIETKEEGPMGTFTFRIPIELKEQTESYCKRQGTTLSRFLRKCCEGLINDYRP